ncbi:NfeD family protein [Labrys sp. KNU-23]|uniref:NfeD family protein n=1 Tax=Labrys sp. KNU-23 TaxID=2789216 RepID=UPI0011EE267F|nr:NfeD family protein [Labrys sp. KNU-23]QEN88379.1 NfeD family protein [Labrys sp. KNU-23]
MNELASINVWGWFVLAAVLIGLEVFLPGAFMIWLGLAAAAVGALSFFWPLSWPLALLLFAVLGVVFAWIGRHFARKVDAADKEGPFLNRRADALIGQSFTLADPIVNGEGRIRVGDTVWQVRGPDAGAGARIKVVRVEGGWLAVEDVSKQV